MEHLNIELEEKLGEEAGFITSLIKRLKRDKNRCVYLVSCVHNKYLFVDDSFEALTAYSSSQFMKEGLEFWLALIHPEDKPIVMEAIIQGHSLLFDPTIVVSEMKPMDLVYRFKKKDGKWIWLCETKWVVPSNKEIKDYIIGSFIDISEQKQKDDLRLLQLKEEGTNNLLKAALEYKASNEKQLINTNQIIETGKPIGIDQLTKREKEVLKLIGEGLSTKRIADKLFISINTVETHRRHLLEKLNVKNSMELIKKTAKAFWL